MTISANMMADNIVFIGLGTNLGEREQNLTTAIAELQEFSEIRDQSSIYETSPVDYVDQPNFLNTAVKISTSLSPIELIVRLEEIEHRMGRKKEIENGPRIIDLDILLFNEEIFETPALKIPHPRLHKRKFVLQPLSEIAGDTVHPILKKSIKELFQNLNSTERITPWT